MSSWFYNHDQHYGSVVVFLESQILAYGWIEMARCSAQGRIRLHRLSSLVSFSNSISSDYVDVSIHAGEVNIYKFVSDLFLVVVPKMPNELFSNICRYCFYRLGLSLGMRNIKCKKAPPNPVLEKAYKISNKWNHKDIVSLSKQTDCTERQIERWLRLRKMQEKPSVIFKFSECWFVFWKNFLLFCYTYIVSIYLF